MDKKNENRQRGDGKDHLENLSGKMSRLEKELADTKDALRECEEGRIESEGQYSYLFRAMISGFAIFDSVFDSNEKFISYRFVDINPAYERITGVKRDEVLGKDIQEVFPGTEQSWIEAYGKVATTGEPALFEMYHEPTKKFYDCSVFKLFDTGYRFCVTFVDITERNQAEQEIQKIALFPSQNPDPVMRIIGKGIIEYANKASDVVLETLGCREGEHVPDLLLEKIKSALRTGAHEDFEIECRGRLFRFRFAPIVDKGYVNLYGLDITEHRKAQQERQRLQLELDHVKRLDAIGQLAGGIAHDFNNILTAIQGNAELLEDMLDEQSEGRTFVKRILHGTSRAAELTRQLLGFARKGKFQILPIDVHHALNDSIMLLSRAIDKGIAINTDFQAEKTVIMGDPAQLENAFLNLGLNARDAMESGGILAFSTRNVYLDEKLRSRHVDNVPLGHYLEICVSDNGIGMDNETVSRIFEPFFTTKAIGKGTGLGLASVYGCVKSHHGTIRVYSEPQKGTVFKIYLPLAGEGFRPVERTDLALPHVGNGCVLIIDDELEVREFVAGALKKLGYSAVMCSGGKEGIKYFKKHKKQIDYVILDLIMPKMDGEQVFDELRKLDPDIKTIIITGFIQNGRTENILRNKDVGFLNKPFSIEELSNAMTCLNRPRD